MNRFLRSRLTARWFRKSQGEDTCPCYREFAHCYRLVKGDDEFYLPELSDRNTFEQWQALGSPTMYGKARDRVKEILAGPQKNPLSDEVLGKLEDIVRRANKELPSET